MKKEAKKKKKIDKFRNELKISDSERDFTMKKNLTKMDVTTCYI